MNWTKKLRRRQFAIYPKKPVSFLFMEILHLLARDNMPSADAAPLICAGTAVYSALHGAGVQPPHKVGVLGRGGLGHLAVPFASKMGCQVTVFSHSADKEEMARSLGASDFQTMSENFLQRHTVDCLLLTGARQPDWSKVILLVRRGGSISAMTVDASELRRVYDDVLMNAINIQGSLPAAPFLQREMLDFASFHGIRPIIEIFPMSEEGANEAMEKLRLGKMRYRGVLARDREGDLD